MYPEPNCTELLSIVPDLKGECGAECEIILPEYCPNILRILQATATASLNSCTKTADRLTVEGKVEYNILYLGEEDNCLKSVTQQTVFSYSLEMKNYGDCDYSVEVLPQNCVARALNPRKIFVRNTLSVTVHLCRTENIPTVPNEENYERKICRKKAAKLLCSAEKPLRITDEFETEGSAITSILQRNILFRETEQKPLTDKLIVKANMILDLLCIGESEVPIVLRQEIPISQILDLPGLTQDSLCLTEFTPIFSNINIKDDDLGVHSISYDVEINVSCKTYCECFAEWTEDVFSVKKALECTKKAITTEHFIPINERESVRETVEIGTCTELLWTDVRPNLKNTFYKSESDNIVCEGVWECRIILRDADGIPGAVQKEIPFFLEVPSGGCKNPIRNDTKLILTDLVWTLTDASHMELRGTYDWNGLIFVRETSETVTEIREKSDLPRKEDTVTLYYASAGESAWTIAKQNACPYMELLRNNQLEEDLLKEETMLVIVSG